MANALDIHPKVAGAGIGGSVSIIALYALGFVLDIPPVVAGAVGVISAALCGWLTPWVQSHQPQ